MELDINVILDGLKEGKNSRTQNSLEKLNSILKAYHKRGLRDFSITQIGRISAAEGGPGYESLRATRNNHYRRLIESWAVKAGTSTKKPLAPFSRSRDVPEDYKLLERISDAAVRALFGQIVAERNRLKTEVSLLKQNANIVIDKRPVSQFDAPMKSTIELLSSLSGVLQESEIQALTYAISDDCMKKQGWICTQAGQVKDMELAVGAEVFPRGFVTGIRKIIGEVDTS